MSNDVHSIPTRRSALSFSAIAPPNVPAPTNCADLANLVLTLDRQWAVTEMIAEEMRRHRGRGPESDAQEARMDAAMDDWWATVDRIIGSRAQSAAGLRAKATAMQRVLACMTLTETMRPKAEQLLDADPEERLAWSLATDMLERFHADWK